MLGTGNPGKGNSMSKVTKESGRVRLGHVISTGLLKPLTAVVKEPVCLFCFLNFPIRENQHFHTIQ